MMSPHRLALLVLVAGTSMPAPSDAASLFDGSYAGTRATTRGGPPTCSDATTGRIIIQDGKFSFKVAAVMLELAVRPDGSFENSAAYMVARRSEVARLAGRIAGNRLTATTSSANCEYTLDLTRGKGG